MSQTKLSSAAVFVKKLHDLAGQLVVVIKVIFNVKLQALFRFPSKESKNLCVSVQKKGYAELPELPREETTPYSYGSTLPKDPTFTSPCSVASSDPSLFLIRGQNYLKDHQKVCFNVYDYVS